MKSVWGKVYYQETYAGILQRDPGGRHIFTYDETYLGSENPAIAFLLPKQKEPFISETGLHPFFDNLVAESWLQMTQAKFLKVSTLDHLSLLLGFGFDLPGAVSIIDPEGQIHEINEELDNITKAALRSYGSLSGVQHKLLVTKKGNTYKPTEGKELSSYIAKLPSNTHSGLIELEYLTTLAIQKLIPEDSCVELEIAEVEGIDEPALIVKRFDRTPSGKRIHFEEFNQLLGHPSGDDKYNGSYEDMGTFMLNTKGCIPAEAFQLYRRILANLLVGNTDAHFKNFAMFHTKEGFRLTPSYDLVAAARYERYQTIALSLGKLKTLKIFDVKPKNLLELGNSFGLNEKLILETVNELGSRIQKAKTAIAESKIGDSVEAEKLIEMMEKRWKGNFSSIGQYLLKKQK